MKAPLEDIRVLDFTRHTSGPYGSLLLADLGAEVIKVETMETPSREETSSPDVKDKYGFAIKGIATHFLALERGKKSIALDRRHAKGKEIMRELVCVSDVVFENFRPGTPRAMGIDYDTLSIINPGIITCSITAYGVSAPLVDRGGYDTIAQAMGGGMSITVGEDGKPTRPGIPIGDNAAGMFAVIGILAAIHARDITGTGQKIDTSLLAGQISLLHYMATDYFASGVSWAPSGLGTKLDACRHWYKCKDGRYIVTMPIRTTQEPGGKFSNYVRALKREDLLADPRFATEQLRLDNAKALLAELNKTFKTKTVEEWEKILDAANVPCGPINSIGEACTQPQAVAEEMIGTYPHPLGGEYQSPKLPIKMSELEPQYIAPPLLGEHTVEILRDLLGYSEEKIAELKKDGAITYP